MTNSTSMPRNGWLPDSYKLFSHLVVVHDESNIKVPTSVEKLAKDHEKLHKKELRKEHSVKALSSKVR